MGGIQLAPMPHSPWKDEAANCRHKGAEELAGGKFWSSGLDMLNSGACDLPWR